MPHLKFHRWLKFKHRLFEVYWVSKLHIISENLNYLGTLPMNHSQVWLHQPSLEQKNLHLAHLYKYHLCNSFPSFYLYGPIKLFFTQISLLGFSQKRGSRFSVLTTGTNIITVNTWLLLSVLQGISFWGVIQQLRWQKFTVSCFVSFTTWFHKFPNLTFSDHNSERVLFGLFIDIIFCQN